MVRIDSSYLLLGKWPFDIAGIDGNDHIIRNLHTSQPADFLVDLTRKFLIIQVSRQSVFDLDERNRFIQCWGDIGEFDILGSLDAANHFFDQSLFGLGQPLDNDS